MEKMVTLVYDESEYMYKKANETDKDYEERMNRFHQKVESQSTPESKAVVAELLKGIDTAYESISKWHQNE